MYRHTMDRRDKNPEKYKSGHCYCDHCDNDLTKYLKKTKGHVYCEKCGWPEKLNECECCGKFNDPKKMYGSWHSSVKDMCFDCFCHSREYYNKPEIFVMIINNMFDWLPDEVKENMIEKATEYLKEMKDKVNYAHILLFQAMAERI